MKKNTNAPRYNRCDICGRNPHKIAVRVPLKERNPNWQPKNGEPYFRLSGRSAVVGYCPSCFGPRDDEKLAANGVVVLYDRRSARTRANDPAPTAPVEEPSEERNGRRVWSVCGHPAERDAMDCCYTCRRPLAS